MYAFIHKLGSHINIRVRPNNLASLNYTMSYPMGTTFKVVVISAEVISWTPYSWVDIPCGRPSVSSLHGLARLILVTCHSEVVFDMYNLFSAIVD